MSPSFEKGLAAYFEEKKPYEEELQKAAADWLAKEQTLQNQDPERAHEEKKQPAPKETQISQSAYQDDDGGNHDSHWTRTDILRHIEPLLLGPRLPQRTMEFLCSCARYHKNLASFVQLLVDKLNITLDLKYVTTTNTAECHKEERES
ncbi:hypothetical protein ABVK25_006505 [Lepraria finkii]|uniref:Uncharacterized protein n=1 Tax=Lepraria finkii TaxID=1340010 RepID=A0ABR4B5N4_9LECA